MMRNKMNCHFTNNYYNAISLLYNKGVGVMTRINVVPVTELTREHLIAEYREITRLPKNLVKSLNRKSKPFSMSEIPSTYILGKGHVKFFYDKMKWLERRYTELLNEMWDRGYNPQFTDPSIFAKCEARFYNDYKPTKQALKINRERIKDRLNGRTRRS